MCRKTQIDYTGCGCRIMVETICFDYIQHTIKQKDRFPCVKMESGGYKLKTVNKTCFLKPGQLLDDGRIFRHGSYRTRLIYEFERDPNGSRRRWGKWQNDNRDKARERTDSLDANISAGEDRMKIEADGFDADVDVDNSHKEREPKIREWKEKTKNETQPIFEIEKQIKKRQPGGKRKIVNHFGNDLSDPRSEDEISDDDWKLDPKVKREPAKTVPWSTTSSRPFSDPTVAKPNSTIQATAINIPGNERLFKSHNSNKLEATDTYKMHPTTPNSRFNFHPPATGTHTKYMNSNMHKTSAPSKRHPPNSTYTNQMNLESPKLKPKTRAQALAHSDHEMQTSVAKFAGRSTYSPMHNPSEMHMHTSFWAGHNHNNYRNRNISFDISNSNADIETEIDTDNPPPYSAHASSLLLEYASDEAMDMSVISNTGANTDTDTKSHNSPSEYLGLSDISSASGYIGYNSTYGENQGVFGNYGGGGSYEQERKKKMNVRAGEMESVAESGNKDADVDADVENAEDDVKMGEE